MAAPDSVLPVTRETAEMNRDYDCNSLPAEGAVHCFWRPSGDLTIKPAPVARVGSNVSVICVKSVNDCHMAEKFTFSLDNDYNIQPHWMNETSAVLRLSNVTKSYVIYCFFNCVGMAVPVNWEILRVGYPPDRPSNLTCFSEELSAVVTCTWDRGWETFIPTSYSAHIKNLQSSEEHVILARETLSIEFNRSRYEDFAFYVTATNALGRSESEPASVLLGDIVVPITPEIVTNGIFNKLFKVVIQWRREISGNIRSCELAYRTPHKADWISVGEQIINVTNALFMRVVLEAEALRVRCRERKGKSYWSGWSFPQNITETGPYETFSVWRAFGSVSSNGSQKVTILIKPNPPEVPWARPLGYNIFYEVEKVRIPVGICQTSEVQCQALLPRGVKTVFVVAYNLRGESEPTPVPVRRDSNGFPAPRNLTVTSGLQTSVPVQWEPPEESENSLLWFVVQRAPDACDGKPQNISWDIVPKDQKQFIIEDRIEAGRRVSVSLFAVYEAGVSQPTINYGFSKELQPRKGPKDIKVKYSGAAALIRWEEVPFCDQKGFIINYTLRLREDLGRSIAQNRFAFSAIIILFTDASARNFTFQHLNPNKMYKVCISASTTAGEGPRETCALLQPDSGLGGHIELLLGIGSAAAALTSFTLTVMYKKKIRERVKTFAVSWIPGFLCEVYPRVENSTALQALQGIKEASGFGPFTSYGDPEIVEVQEILAPKPTSPPIPAAEPSTNPPESPLLPAPADVKGPEETPGYQPQAVKGVPPRRDSYCTPSFMLEVQRAAGLLAAGEDCGNRSVLFRDAASALKGLFFRDAELVVSEDIGEDDLSIVLQADDATAAKFLRGPPDLCLPGGAMEFTDMGGYFPQTLAKGN
ncbi:interleukin-12 receptor subunit beta-2-like [Spea bombifrons]|uniref:interleukin-12 receptor subunit beta-2-like n=1 Tax=Spea bombifrons TaxID=233779 RepID=UPI00234ACB99|nr:interleukin-12 receptor subunit beta-2-like [Spea bombifrons]